MKRILIILLTLIFVTIMPAIAGGGAKLQIIYPHYGAKINASSTFFVGNTDPEACLTINNKPVKVWSNGAFVEVVSLNKGINKINVKTSTKTTSKEINYILKVPEKQSTTSSRPQKPLSFTAEVAKDYVVTRTAPGQDRLTPLLKGTLIEITAKSGNNYRFKYSDNLSGWIARKDIKYLYKRNNLPDIKITDLNVDADENYVYLKVSLPQKVPFIIEQPSENEMKLKLFRAVSLINGVSSDNTNHFIKELKWTQDSKDCLSLSIKTTASNFWGYKYYYEGNNLVLRLRKPPETNFFYPLFGKTICIDAGHGGKESGSVGPTAVAEKTINLQIAENLKKILESKGAKVIMTRVSDKYVDLYDRVHIANSNNAQILVSIHNNALPDGKNPYEEHGTTTYYYHSQSIPLAKSIQKALVQLLGFKDSGIHNSSFVLTRPTEVPSVLVEIGFMIYPEEYNLLIMPEFQEKAALGIASGLENFFLNK